MQAYHLKVHCLSWGLDAKVLVSYLHTENVWPPAVGKGEGGLGRVGERSEGERELRQKRWGELKEREHKKREGEREGGRREER